MMGGDQANIYVTNSFFCYDSQYNLMVCGNDCPGVNPNAIIVGEYEFGLPDLPYKEFLLVCQKTEKMFMGGDSVQNLVITLNCVNLSPNKNHSPCMTIQKSMFGQHIEATTWTLVWTPGW